MRAGYLRTSFLLCSLFLILIVVYCSKPSCKVGCIQTVTGTVQPRTGDLWLSHEHILVDFIGADSINPPKWNRDTVTHYILPYLEELKSLNIMYFVDATPDFLGRDVGLLANLSKQTGIKILTNTGLYGAVLNKYIPSYAYDKSASELSEMWINEYDNGINGTEIKPGFIKISVDPVDTLDKIDVKLVQAAALTHLATGLTIGSHTGPAHALWPQLDILRSFDVSPSSFIWIHAQNEDNHSNYVKAAHMGCWISLDGLGWDTEKHIDKLLFAKDQNILGSVLISHDAGWYDPRKDIQAIKPFTNIFEELLPALASKGFNEEDFDLLLSKNPMNAFTIKVRKG